MTILLLASTLLAFHSDATCPTERVPINPGPPVLGLARPRPQAHATAEPVESFDQDVWLPPGTWAAFTLDGGTGLVSAELPEIGALTASAASAVAACPAWLQGRLTLTLSYLDSTHQDELGAMILGEAGQPWLDELAFTVAAMAPEDLGHSYFDPEILLDNAEAIYTADPLLDYVELVENDDDSGPWTTTRYNYTDTEGQPATWTLPAEDYYWYVVHPRLDAELAIYLDPEAYTLGQPPEAVHWREWFLLSSLDPDTWDYRTHYLQETPRAVDPTEPDLLVADGVLSDFTVDPLIVLADAKGRPVLIEADWGVGSILASTADLETAWSEGVTDLAENVALYVDRRDVLETPEATLILVDPMGPPEMGQVFAEILEAEGLPFTLASPGKKTWATLDDYDKIIVPRGGSADFLAEIGAWGKSIESFVASGKTLVAMVDLDSAGLDEWAFPGGFTATATPVADLRFVGHPVLSEVLQGVTSLWDLSRQDGLSGERALVGGEYALDVLGWWVTQNMFDNVSEYMESHGTPDRSVWPQRILHEHFGNCGECQDMVAAAFKTALVPNLNVQSLEDHVWNQFYFLDAWHPFQVDWSDSATRIDNDGVGSDEDKGGGKIQSAMLGYMGNGRMRNEDIALYSDTITLDVLATDGRGEPIDGADVVVLTQSYYYDSVLDEAAWVHTAPDGRASILLGDGRDYWVTVRTEIGGERAAYPFDLDEDTLSSNMPGSVLATEAGDPFILSADAKAGTTFSFAHEFNRVIGVPAATLAESDGSHLFEVWFNLHSTETFTDVPATDTYLGFMASLGYAFGGRLIDRRDATGPLDYYLMEPDQYTLFAAGEPFEAAFVDEGVMRGDWEWSDEHDDTGDSMVDTGPILPVASVSTESDQLVLVISNVRGQHSTHYSQAEISFETTTTEETEKEKGCGCTATPRPMAVLGFLGLVALTWRRRRTSGT